MYQYQQIDDVINWPSEIHPSLKVKAPQWQEGVKVKLSKNFPYANLISQLQQSRYHNEYTFIYHVNTSLEAALLRRCLLDYVEVYAAHTLTIERFNCSLIPDELVHRISLLPLDYKKFNRLRENKKLFTKGELDNTLIENNDIAVRDIDLLIDVSAYSKKHLSDDDKNLIPSTYIFPPCYFNSDHIKNSPFISNNITPLNGEIIVDNKTVKKEEYIYATLTLRPGIGSMGLKYQCVSTCIAVALEPTEKNDPLAVSKGFYHFTIRLVGNVDLETVLISALKAVEVNEPVTHMLFPNL
jgi:hypothetical protein